MLPVDAEHRASRAFWDCDLFVAIGTSGLVYPAAGYVRSAKYSGATTMLLNLDPQDQPAPFDHVLLGRAEVRLPALLRDAEIPDGLGTD